MKSKLSPSQQKALLYRAMNDRVPKTKYGYPLDGLLLPNVDYFSVCSGRMDKLAESFGILRKIMRHIMSGKAQNTSGNRYLTKVWTKLHLYAIQKDEKKFTSLSNILMRHSKAMRSLMIWRKSPTWYKSKSMSQVITLMHEIDDILFEHSTILKASQFKIEKADGSLRTITSPSLAWRIVCHWHYQLTWLWLFGTDQLPSPCQHGGVKWKGTKSCLQELEKKVLDSKFILEFDLSKFFDRIRWTDLLKMGLRLKIPTSSLVWILNSIYNAPSHLSYDIESETEHKIALELVMSGNWKSLKQELGEKALQEFITNSAKEDDEYYRSSTLNEIQKEENEERKTQLFKILSWIKPFRAGVPQGHPLSPLFAVLTLHKAYDELNENLLMYMDDGIIYGNTNEEVNNTLQRLGYLVELYTGVAINLSKSK